jgi:carbon-monoxide dehydrogenase large subunit
MIVPPRHALTGDRVRHVGDAVAFVVAETRTGARDAAEAVVVDYDTLPAIVDPLAASHEDAPQLWDQAPRNTSFRFQKGDADAVQAALAGAPHVAELELVNNRIVIAAMETRGAIGSHDGQGFHLQYSGAGTRNTVAASCERRPCTPAPEYCR